jgi:hypothetical protein
MFLGYFLFCLPLFIFWLLLHKMPKFQLSAKLIVRIRSRTSQVSLFPKNPYWQAVLCCMRSCWSGSEGVPITQIISSILWLRFSDYFSDISLPECINFLKAIDSCVSIVSVFFNSFYSLRHSHIHWNIQG